MPKQGWHEIAVWKSPWCHEVITTTTGLLATTKSGGHMGVVIRSTTGCCSTRHATDNSIPPWVRRVCRTPSHGCSERLEPDIGKLICPVLRGGGGGNVVPLLDTMKLTVLDQYGKGLVQCEAVVGKEIRAKV